MRPDTTLRNKSRATVAGLVVTWIYLLSNILFGISGRSNPLWQMPRWAAYAVLAGLLTVPTLYLLRRHLKPSIGELNPGDWILAACLGVSTALSGYVITSLRPLELALVVAILTAGCVAIGVSGLRQPNAVARAAQYVLIRGFLWIAVPMTVLLVSWDAWSR